MRISTKGRYSLEALLYLGLLPKGEYASTRTIAENTGLSEGYLEQLFIPLRKSGLLHGIRGPLGGYSTGRPAEKITVGEILRAVEGDLEPVDCVKSRKCPRTTFCISKLTWTELYEAINNCVDSITLKDLVESWEYMDKAEYVI
jgi:Rrf2 family protein